MKLIIMSQTVVLLAPTFEKQKSMFFDEGFVVKEVNKIQYLIKKL